ncbi:hypothetical protein [Bacillus mobilis]
MIFDRFLKPANSYIDIGAWIGPTVFYGTHKILLHLKNLLQILV